MPLRIEDYALVGDLQTAALIGRNGSIDWLCLPRFDSGACFAALLGDERNGRWLIAPTDADATATWRYTGDTLVLETTWETSSGSVRVLDFMPPRDEAAEIVRIVEGVRGSVELRWELVVRFDYGSVVPWVRRVDRTRQIVAGPDALCLTTPVEVRGENMRTIAQFVVEEGDRVPFVLTWYPSYREPPTPVDAEQALRETTDFWEDWISTCVYDGDQPEHVHRSLIVLKALTYAPTGGIVAAPTTSLPEHAGGVRNWDYRYCWLRDATLTLLALISAGYSEEADAWRLWLLRAAAGDPADLQILYGVAGERRLEELELGWLSGYEGSTPVRIGNLASEQLQLDVYGEVMDALYQARKHGLGSSPEAWSLQKVMLRHLELIWREPDFGIWEVRGRKQHFVHSKVMAWVAFDRAVRTVLEQGLDGDAARWSAIRDQIHEDVTGNGFDAGINSFTQYYGSGTLDANLLMIPLVGFLPATDPRVRGTIEAVRRDLMRDGLIERYHTAGGVDGLPTGEGVFLPCSFWLVDCLELLGEHREAHALFSRLLSLASDLGLISEEYDPVAGRLLGNYPQAFTHLELVNTAFNLAREHASPMEKRHARR
ncbi:MAG: glycoside hydrolase family 15 protein [Gaiellaceae bacterium]